MKETDLFEPVKKWLEAGGHEVYSEVRVNKYGGKRADVVGVHGSITTVVEMKTSLSMELIEQAVWWKQFANYVYVAIPNPKKHLSDFACRILNREGIGLLTVEFSPFPTMEPHVRNSHRCNAKIIRRTSAKLRESLTEYHKDGPPGGHSGGGYITAYKITMINVRKYLDDARRTWNEYGAMRGRDGWRTIPEILEHVTTHYSSPKPSLSAALQKFEHEWCEKKVEDRKLYFRVKQSEGTGSERVK